MLLFGDCSLPLSRDSQTLHQWPSSRGEWEAATLLEAGSLWPLSVDGLGMRRKGEERGGRKARGRRGKLDSCSDPFYLGLHIMVSFLYLKSFLWALEIHLK